MPTMELEQAFADVPENVLNLRDELSEILISRDHDALKDPKVIEAGQVYAHELGQHWQQVTEDVTREKFGEDITETPRMSLYKLGGALVQQAAHVESTEIMRTVDNNESVPRYKRVGKILGKIFGPSPDLTCIEKKALESFIVELNLVEIGKLQTPGDLGEVVSSTAERIIKSELLTS